MGLRCLLGHDFGEPETERERNEEGNEVVVTVREVKTCERCGEKQVVSENKEITSIDQLRESAAGVQSPTGEDTADGAWGDAEPTARGGGVDESEPGGGTEPAESTRESTVEPDEDPIERGVADIIEQAEKDDDMLEQPPEGPAEPETDAAGDDGSGESDDVPVHPGQRSAAAEESETPDAESDDGVILDDDTASPPEEGRRREEQASPEEAPRDEPNDDESRDAGDAEIIDAGADASDADEPAPEQSDIDDSHQSDTVSAAESDDAEIIDAEPSGSQPDPAGDDESMGSPTEAAETDEGHMPWPDAPGEDTGHDATAPDGEPADVDFDDISPADVATESADTEADQTNGHRTESGESSEASTTPTANVDLERSSRDAELEYYCPECGLTRDVGNSSMRAGDICPECRVGYITEQQKAE